MKEDFFGPSPTVEGEPEEPMIVEESVGEPMPKAMVAGKLATYFTPEAVSQRLKDRLEKDPLETRLTLREVFVLVQDILGAAGESALRNTLERHGVL